MADAACWLLSSYEYKVRRWRKLRYSVIYQVLPVTVASSRIKSPNFIQIRSVVSCFQTRIASGTTPTPTRELANVQNCRFTQVLERAYFVCTSLFAIVFFFFIDFKSIRVFFGICPNNLLK